MRRFYSIEVSARETDGSQNIRQGIHERERWTFRSTARVLHSIARRAPGLDESGDAPIEAGSGTDYIELNFVALLSSVY
jgi:hypothetical protein